MKRLSVIALFVIIFAVSAGFSMCGVQVKAPDIKPIVTNTGPKLVGALIAENNPTYVDIILGYGDTLLIESNPFDFKAKLDDGIDWLLKKYVDKAAIRVLIIDCLPQVEIEQSTVPTPEWMDKVKPIVKAFIEGVKIGAS